MKHVAYVDNLASLMYGSVCQRANEATPVAALRGPPIVADAASGRSGQVEC